MKNRSGEKIKLASIDELLGVVNEESAMEIEISKIHPFKNHPFKVLDDEKMQDLVESVKINGVLTPVLLRICWSVPPIENAMNRLVVTVLRGGAKSAGKCISTVFIFTKTGFQETSHGCRTQGKTVCSICGTSWTG